VWALRDARVVVIDPAVEWGTQRGFAASTEFSRSTRIESLLALGRWGESMAESLEFLARDAERGGSQTGVMVKNHVMSCTISRVGATTPIS
jgi:proline dehydrogenase